MLFCEQKAKFPYPSLILGRVLGPSEDITNEMSQWILRVDGRILSRQTVRQLTNEELWSPLEIARRKAFDAAIKRKLGDSNTIPKKQEPEEYLPYEDEEGSDGVHEIPDTDPTLSAMFIVFNTVTKVQYFAKKVVGTPLFRIILREIYTMILVLIISRRSYDHLYHESHRYHIGGISTTR